MWDWNLFVVIVAAVLIASTGTVLIVLGILYRLGLLGPGRQAPPIVLSAPAALKGLAQELHQPLADAPSPPAHLGQTIKPKVPQASTLNRLRIELRSEDGLLVKLLYSEGGPGQELLSAPRTALASSMEQAVIDLATEGSGLPLFTRELINDLEPGGALLVGRAGGHVEVEKGFAGMSRVLFEVTVKDGRFQVSCKKSVGEIPIQVKVSARPPITQNASSAPQIITGPTEIRQVLPSITPPGGNGLATERKQALSSWYFVLTPC